MSVYSASDIQKYLRGELSAPEMHQLELAALEDPLLSDALEGMALHHSLPSPSSFGQDLGELQQRLDKRVGKKERKGLLFRSSWQTAAVLILLVGLGLTAYNILFFTSGTAKSRLAEKQDTQPGNSQPVAASPATADSSSLPNQGIANKLPPAATADKSATKDPRAAVPGTAEQATAKNTGRLHEPAASSPAVPPSSGLTSSPTLSPFSTLPSTLAPTRPADKSFEAIKADKEKEIASNDVAKMEKAAARSNLNFKLTDTTKYVQGFISTNQSLSAAPSGNLMARKVAGLDITSPADQLVFNGKVIDQNNRPLSGAALYLAGNYLSNTTTDKNGNFSLRLPKNDTALKLTIGYVGYEQTSLGLSTDNRTSNIIQLQPQASAMNEVIVTGYGTKRKEILKNNSKPQKESLPTKASPVNGWTAYQSYLDVSKIAVNPDSTLKGTEIISFIVNKEGTLSSFKVEQSLSPAHDSAAIHLIQQGPSWKLLKGKRTRAWVTISF